MPARPRSPGGSFVRMIGKIALIVVALIVVAWLTAGRVASWQRTTVQREWAGSYGDWDAFLARHPPRDANAAALAAERHAAELGVALAPRGDGAPRVAVDPERSGRFDDVRKPLFDWMAAELARAGGPVSAPPDAGAEFLRERVAEMDAMRAALVGGEVPRWSLHLEDGFATRIPNLNGHILLQRLLLSDALASLHAGDRPSALLDLEASWTLNAGLRGDPILITQLVAMAVTRMQLGVLRRVPDPPAEWIARLRGHDAREPFEEALRLEGLLWTRPATVVETEMLRDQPPDGRDAVPLPAFERIAGVVLAPFERLCSYEHAGRWLADMKRLDDATLSCSRDDEPFAFSEPPRWNLIGRIVTSNSGDAVERLARLELDRELTLRWLELGARRRELGAWPADLPGPGESGACPGAPFRYAVEDGRASLSLDVRPRWPPAQHLIALPTRVESGGPPPDGA